MELLTLAIVVLILGVQIPGCITSSNRHKHYVTGPRIHRSINRLSRGRGMIQIPSRILTCLPRCISCDAINGCTQCRSRTFLYLKNRGHRQEGVCLHQCPEGYYGLRGTTTNTCRRCEASNCISCFTHNYCTACQEGFLLHDAKCLKTCPSELAPDRHKKKCEPKVDCVLSSWSSWSKCARRKPSRSCKYGRKKRTRTIVQEPTENGRQCSKLKETKRCRTPENKCPLINKWYLKQLKKKNSKKIKGQKGQRASKKNRKRRRKKITTNNSNLTPPRSGKLSIET